MPLLDLMELTERDRHAVTRARLAALVSSSADAIAVTTLDGIITDWNPAAVRLFGYTAEEAIGQSLAIVTPLEQAHEPAQFLAKLHQGESIEGVETVRRAKDGRLVDVALTLSPIRTDDGQIIAASAIVRDITARKAAEAERQATHLRTRQVLERITDGFYALDHDWRFTYVNTTAERVLGRSRAELLGTNIWEEFPQAVENPVYPSYHQAMTTGLTTAVEFYYPPLAGWFEARAYPCSNGLSVFFSDVTARKRMEQQLEAALATATTHQETPGALERTTDGVTGSEREGRITARTDAAARDRERTREDLKQATLEAGAAFIGSSMLGHDDADDEGVTLLTSSLAWLRAEVRQAESAEGDAQAAWPRDALYTLLGVLEELQRLLPVAIARLIDDAVGRDDAEIDAAERERALRMLLSRHLLSRQELTSMSREALIAMAARRF